MHRLPRGVALAVHGAGIAPARATEHVRCVITVLKAAFALLFPQLIACCILHAIIS